MQFRERLTADYIRKGYRLECIIEIGCNSYEIYANHINYSYPDNSRRRLFTFYYSNSKHHVLLYHSARVGAWFEVFGEGSMYDFPKNIVEL